MESTEIILPPEAELYVQALNKIELKDIGSVKWQQQHEYLEKLNMQAVVSASQQQDEFVKEFLITYEKIPVLVYEVIATEIWKQNIFPEIIASDNPPKVTFPIYMVLYHEATVVNLLETTLFHKEAAEASEDTILDLLDYCYRKLSILVSKADEDNETEESEESLQSESNTDELLRQDEKLNFDVCTKAVSLLRYITDHLPGLPLGVMSRMLNTHDVPILLVQLVTSSPWTRTKNGKMEKYIENKWQVISNEDRFKLTKIEGQVWLSLYTLLMSSDCQQKYELNPFRKNIILKLRSHVPDVLLDQLPILADLRYYLEQLSMMDPPPPSSSQLILEQVPEIRDGILHEYNGKWAKIAEKQCKKFFNSKSSNMRAQAERLANTYNLDALESLITDPPKCVFCGEPAAKRCSRCQNEWYCRRECQVNHWKKHKKACNLLVESLEKVKIAEDSK